jgi:sulfopyruvate decarboxylase TPP-binding subunit
LFTGQEFAATLEEQGITHVVWLPDSEVGPWEEALASSPRLRLIRVCREGEAWPLAAGLHLGGQVPLIIMQSTGLFESGDALRNVLFDLRLPLFALIGIRNGLVSESRDSAKQFAEPIVEAWGLDCVRLLVPQDKPRFAEHVLRCRRAGLAGVALLAEGPLA